jgi:prolyl-tRNA synthetase
LPHNIAPYEVIIIGLNTDKHEVAATAEDLYKNLQDMGIETLYDDRQETAGVKLNDADLIGIPLRVVVSNRNLSKGCIEVKTRTSEEAEMITLSNACEEIKGILEKIN